MALHMINTTVADRQLEKCYFYKTGTSSYSQNIIINANTKEILAKPDDFTIELYLIS